jgi:outer membrane protein assembly complex protein YaeT
MVTRQVMVTAFVVCFVAGVARATRDEEPLRAAAREPAAPLVEAAGAPIIDDIAFTGLRRIAPEALEAQIASRAGERFDGARIAGDVRTLARLGWFASIRVEVESPSRTLDLPRDGWFAGLKPGGYITLESPEHLRLNFYLQEQPFLTNVEYAGSRLLSQQQIEKLLAEKKLAAKLGEPENPATLQQIAGAIQSALAELAHPEGSVQIRRIESSNATVRVRFEIVDGPHLSVGRVTFAGDPGVSAKLLRREMRRISPGAFFGSLRGKNAYTREGFEEDRERLLAYYQNHGFPEARIGTARVSQYDTSSRRWLPWPQKTMHARLSVSIPVEAGSFYRMASVDVSKALTQAAIARKKSPATPLEVQPGLAYSARAVENLRRAWQARIQPKPRRNETGVFRNVEAIRTLDATSGTVRVRLDLSPTPPYLVRRLEFRGLHRFPDRYLRSRIFLKEGAPLDDQLLEAGLARLARTGYFKPIKKEDVHVETNEAARAADVTIQVEELGQQRASLVGGHGQFGSTLGIAYSLFNLLDREELLSSRIEGGPESLQLAMGFAKDGFLGSRGSLALSVFDTFLRPLFYGSVKGPFLKQETEGIDAAWSYALTNANSLRISYDLSRSKTQYSPTLPTGVTGVTVSEMPTETSSHAAGLGWTHDTGDERIVFADSVSGGWLGGSENLVRSKAEYGRVLPDPFFDRQNSWAFRTSFTGAGSYSGDMPFYARLFAGDDFVRGLRSGELGPDAVVSSTSAAGTTKYSASPAGANLVGVANAEYRVRLANGTEASGFFDLGSGMLLPNWLGQTRPALIDSTNGILHGSTGVQLQWTVPGVGVPVRAYYALNVLRLNRWLSMPDDSLFHVHDRFSAFGWGLGSLF